MRSKKKEFNGGGSIAEEEEVANDGIEGMSGKVMPEFKMYGRPLKFPSVTDLQKRIEEYFDYCDPHIEKREVPTYSAKRGWFVDVQYHTTEQQPYTVSGLALFLDTDRSTLLDYQYLVNKKKVEDIPLHLRHQDPKILELFSHTIKKAKSKIETYVERRLLGGGHPVGSIFNLKNNFPNWEDRTVVDNKAERDMREQVEEMRKSMTDRIKQNKKSR